MVVQFSVISAFILRSISPATQYIRDFLRIIIESLWVLDKVHFLSLSSPVPLEAPILPCSLWIHHSFELFNIPCCILGKALDFSVPHMKYNSASCQAAVVNRTMCYQSSTLQNRLVVYSIQPQPGQARFPVPLVFLSPIPRALQKHQQIHVCLPLC